MRVIRFERGVGESVRVIAPLALAVTLFVVTAYGLFLPAFRDSILERKKDMLRQLTQSAVSTLSHEHARFEGGHKTELQAKADAIALVKSLRYGKRGKDYFWIHDMHPRMVMHPHRQDLDGKDLSNFSDPEGTRPFVHMVGLVKSQQEGFTPYLWQGKDDPHRVVPKLSHVRQFKPWGWIVGTGVYLDDVRAEVALLTRYLNYASAIILLLIALISAYVVRQGLRTATRRRAAEDEVETYRTHLEKLVAQRTSALAAANEQLNVKIEESQAAEAAREGLIGELTEALSKVKTLTGFLPICAACKKIRDDTGYWNLIEEYIERNSEAECSHSLCPHCAERLYGAHGKASSA